MAWNATGASVSLSKIAASSILFAKNGAETIRLVETEEVVEVRGLTKSEALKRVGVTDNTQQTMYYAHIGDDDHSITVTSGEKVEISASRANNADGWTVSEKHITYATTPSTLPACWKTSRAEAGVTQLDEIVSRDRSSSYIWHRESNTVFSTKTTTVSESKGLTKDEADAIVNATATENTYGITTLYWQAYNKEAGGGLPAGWITWAYTHAQTGKDVCASARKISDEEGWSVTKTVVEYGWAATGNNNTQRWVAA